jgi:hypothetical protein
VLWLLGAIVHGSVSGLGGLTTSIVLISVGGLFAVFAIVRLVQVRLAFR